MSVQLLGESTLEYMLEDITQFYNTKAGDSGVQAKSIFLLQVCYTKDHRLAFLILTSFAAEAIAHNQHIHFDFFCRRLKSSDRS